MKKTKFLMAMLAFMFLGLTTMSAQMTEQDQIAAIGTQAKYYETQGKQLVTSGTMTVDDVMLRRAVYKNILVVTKQSGDIDYGINTTITQLMGGSATSEGVSLIEGVSLTKVQAQALKDEVYDLF